MRRERGARLPLPLKRMDKFCKRFRQLFDDLPADPAVVMSFAAELYRGRLELELRLAEQSQPKPDGDGRAYTLKVGDVMGRLNVSRGWVYDHREDLGGKKIGGHVRFSDNGLARYVARK